MELRQIRAVEAIPAILEGLNDRFGGAAEDLVETFTGSMIVLQDRFKIFAGSIAGEVFDKIRDDVQALTDWITDPSTEAGARDVASALGAIYDVGRDVADVAVDALGKLDPIWDLFKWIVENEARLKGSLGVVTASLLAWRLGGSGTIAAGGSSGALSGVAAGAAGGAAAGGFWSKLPGFARSVPGAAKGLGLSFGIAGAADWGAERFFGNEEWLMRLMYGENPWSAKPQAMDTSYTMGDLFLRVIS